MDQNFTKNLEALKAELKINRPELFSHPEKKEDEVWITNAPKETISSKHEPRNIPEGATEQEIANIEKENAYDLKTWEYIKKNMPVKYESVRAGDVAYDTNGKPIKGWIPVFVSLEEYLEKTSEV